MKKTVYGFVLGLAAFVLGAGLDACDTGSLGNPFADPVYTATGGTFTGGKITLNPTNAAAGTNVTVMVTPDAGYMLVKDSLKVNDGLVAISGSANPYIFVMPAGNVTVTAVFEPVPEGVYTVTFGDLENGSVAADPAYAAAGAAVTLAVTPDAGFRLAEGGLAVTDANGGAVKVTGAGTAFIFSMPAGGVTVAAVFEALPADIYSVTVSPLANGKVSASLDSAAEGTEVTLTVSPAAGYRLAEGGLTVTGANGGAVAVSNTVPYTFTMPASHVTVAAAFEDLPPDLFSITVSPLANGTVSASHENAAEGTEVTLTVSANAGYLYTADSLAVTDGDGGAVAVSNTVPCTFEMPASNVTVAAQFTAISYAVTVSAMTNGSVTANPPSAAEGTEVTLTVSPAAGFRLAAGSLTVIPATGAAITPNGTGNTWKFTMPSGDVTVAAAFEALPADIYSVTVSDTLAGGTVSASHGEAAAGTEVTLAVSADTGYLYTAGSLKINGSAAGISGSGTSFKFTMPAEHVTVTAEFTITYTAIADGTPNTAASTAINFVFAGAVALAEGDITVTDGTGKVTKGALSGDGGDGGDGTNWSLEITVNTAGNVKVRINKTGIQNAEKTVAVYKVPEATPDITYDAIANGAVNMVTSTAIAFGFAEAVTGLTAGDIAVTAGPGNVTTGALTGGGTSWSLAITVNTAGNITVAVNKAGIESGAKTVAVYKVSSLTLDNVTADGANAPFEPTTTVTLTFSGDVPGLTAGDIVIETEEDASITKGALTAKGGGVYELAVEALLDVGPNAGIAVSVTAAGATVTREATLYAWIGIDGEFFADIGKEGEFPVDGWYKQTANITITGAWTPIAADGDASLDTEEALSKCFSGVFDGGGFEIIPNNVSAAVPLGIFANAYEATFQNVHIGTGSMTLTANQTLGGIAAVAKKTSFINCSNAAALSGQGFIGGICGILYVDSIIDNCENTGSIISTANANSIGGICAVTMMATDVTIKNSRNSGSITISGSETTSAITVGGIVGSNMLSNPTIEACYNTGAITVSAGKSNSVGGIVGRLGNTGGTITACYNTGAISSTIEQQAGGLIYIGGITGINAVKANTLTASYNTGTVSYTGSGSGATVKLGGISGCSEWNSSSNATITACYWKADTATNGIGYKKTAASAGDVSNVGTSEFASGTWPAASESGWGIGNDSASGKYWKSLGSWGGGSPTYPTLWFE
jgi:hypothetical protein